MIAELFVNGKSMGLYNTGDKITLDGQYRITREVKEGYFLLEENLPKIYETYIVRFDSDVDFSNITNSIEVSCKLYFELIFKRGNTVLTKIELKKGEKLSKDDSRVPENNVNCEWDINYWRV